METAVAAENEPAAQVAVDNELLQSPDRFITASFPGCSSIAASLRKR